MTCECVYQFFGWIGKFVDSNFFQTVVMVITVVVTVREYQKQIYQKEKDAASVVLLQINSIHDHVEKLSGQFMDSEKFDIPSMWCATKVFDENYWEQYKQLLLRYLSSDKIRDINQYYTYATVINRQIEAFHDMIYAIYENYYIERKMEPLYKIDSQNPHIRTFTVHLNALQNNCDEALKSFSSYNLKSSLEILEKISCSDFRTWRKRRWER